VEEKILLTGFYIECERLTVQIAILYDRATFLWLPEDDYQAERQFCDTARAFRRFELSTLVDDQSDVRVLVPSNIKFFLFEYDHSKFLECNKALSKNISIDKGYKIDVKRDAIIAKGLVYLASYLESIYKHYWLASGTLLGGIGLSKNNKISAVVYLVLTRHTD
jgi:hypothetical protein